MNERFLILDATTHPQPVLLHDWLPHTAHVILRNWMPTSLTIIVVRSDNKGSWSDRFEVPGEARVLVSFANVEPYIEPPREAIDALYKRMFSHERTTPEEPGQS